MKFLERFCAGDRYVLGRRRFLQGGRRVAVAFLICAVAACGGGERDPYGEGGLNLDENARDYSFAGDFFNADRAWDIDVLQPGRLAHRRFLKDGWSFPGNAKPVEGDIVSLWADELTSTVEFWWSELSDRTLNFQAFPKKLEGSQQSVRVSLNGEFIGEAELGQKWQALSFKLPAALQRKGFNHIGFEYAYVARPRDEAPVNGKRSSDHRRLAVSMHSLEVVPDHDDVARRRAEALKLCNVGARPVMNRLTIEQVSGSQLAYHMEVPPGARFQTSLLYIDRGSKQPEQATFRVRLNSAEGESAVVFEQIVPYREELNDVEADLSAYAGQIVRLDFELEAADGSKEPVLGAWIAPGLDATEAEEPQAPQLEIPAAAREELKNRPVVMILLDALSPSFLSCYGGREGLTPNIDRIASEGLRFDNAWAQATYTIASVSSTLTSSYTWDHSSWKESTKILDDVQSWPEHFQAAGYRTAAVVCSPNGASRLGLERGFETYKELFTSSIRTKGVPYAEEVIPAVEAIVQQGDERPLFLWVHIIEPHEPYHPPASWRGRFGGEYKGEVTGDDETLWNIRRRDIAPSDEDIAHLRHEYEENLGYVDEMLGRMRVRLEELGVWDEAVFFLFSDHGEGFMQHDGEVFSGMGHGSTVYEEMVQIPIIASLPADLGRTGEVSKSLAAGIDLLPTAADLVGIDPKQEGSVGTSLAPEFFSELGIREYLISHSASFDSAKFLPALTLRVGDLKYVHTSGEGFELYDLARDPGELNNLADEQPILAGWMRQQLRRRSGFNLDEGGVAGLSATDVANMTESERLALEKLGYLGDD